MGGKCPPCSPLNETLQKEKRKHCWVVLYLLVHTAATAAEVLLWGDVIKKFYTLNFTSLLDLGSLVPAFGGENQCWQCYASSWWLHLSEIVNTFIILCAVVAELASSIHCGDKPGSFWGGFYTTTLRVNTVSVVIRLHCQDAVFTPICIHQNHYTLFLIIQQYLVTVTWPAYTWIV